MPFDSCGLIHARRLLSSDWANHACTMLLGFLSSYVNASVIIVLHQESSPMAQTAMKLLQRH